MVLPSSVLFCCDLNAVRSPMAEGMMKKFYGTGCYVQSAGVRSDLDIDGFAVSVCKEIGVELSRHRSRSFDEMRDWGDDLSGFDLIVALSPASQRQALELTRLYHLTVEYWPVLDPLLSTEPITKDLCTGVKSVTFRYMDVGRNWRDTWPPATAVANAGQLNLRLRPVAIEVTLELNDWGKIVRVLEVPT